MRAQSKAFALRVNITAALDCRRANQTCFRISNRQAADRKYEIVAVVIGNGLGISVGKCRHNVAAVRVECSVAVFVEDNRIAHSLTCNLPLRRAVNADTICIPRGNFFAADSIRDAFRRETAERCLTFKVDSRRLRAGLVRGDNFRVGVIERPNFSAEQECFVLRDDITAAFNLRCPRKFRIGNNCHRAFDQSQSTAVSVVDGLAVAIFEQCHCKVAVKSNVAVVLEDNRIRSGSARRKPCCVFVDCNVGCPCFRGNSNRAGKFTFKRKCPQSCVAVEGNCRNFRAAVVRNNGNAVFVVETPSLRGEEETGALCVNFTAALDLRCTGKFVIRNENCAAVGYLQRAFVCIGESH